MPFSSANGLNLAISARPMPFKKQRSHKGSSMEMSEGAGLRWRKGGGSHAKSAALQYSCSGFQVSWAKKKVKNYIGKLRTLSACSQLTLTGADSASLYRLILNMEIITLTIFGLSILLLFTTNNYFLKGTDYFFLSYCTL